MKSYDPVEVQYILDRTKGRIADLNGYRLVPSNDVRHEFLTLVELVESAQREIEVLKLRAELAEEAMSMQLDNEITAEWESWICQPCTGKSCAICALSLAYAKAEAQVDEKRGEE